MSEWRPRPRRHPVPQLGLGWRVFFVASGWILVLVGLAGLALPGIQGVLTILLGGALLSLASETAYWMLRWAFRRWPRGWRKLERLRRRIYAKLGATNGGDPRGTAGPGPASPGGGERPPRAPERGFEAPVDLSAQRSESGTQCRSVGPV